MFRGDEVLERPVLKELELTDKKTLRRVAMSDKVTGYDKNRQTRFAELERRGQISEAQSAVQKAAPK